MQSAGLAAFPNEPSICSVLPHLLIGDIVAAQSPELLASKGVTRLVDLANMFPEPGGPRLLEITERLDPPIRSKLEVRVSDISTEDISWAFEAVNSFIEAARERGENVLVHCFQGKSRSPTIAIAYLMMSEGYTLREAYTLVKEARPSINPNDGFKRLLMAIEKSKFPYQQPSLTFQLRETARLPTRHLGKGKPHEAHRERAGEIGNERNRNAEVGQESCEDREVAK